MEADRPARRRPSTVGVDFHQGSRFKAKLLSKARQRDANGSLHVVYRFSVLQWRQPAGD
eukprot:COSAG05_NODE_16171_length_352_cov_0.616601_1_plen_58_part_10